MSHVTIDGNSWVLQTDDGTQTELWNASDLFSNHSGVGLMGMLDKHGECKVEESFMVRLYRDMAQLADTFNGTARKAAMILILKAMIRKYRPFRVLWLGSGDCTDYAEVLGKYMRELHEGSRVYRMTEKTEEPRENMPLTVARYEDMIFPEGKFDAVILDAEGASGPADRTCIELICALKPFGRFFSIQNYNFPQGVFEKLFDESSCYDTDRTTLYVAAATPAAIRKAQDETTAGAVRQLKAYVRAAAASWKIATREAADVEGILAQVNEAEDIVQTIFAELESTDIKYRLARFREALMDYQLEIGDLKTVREAYSALREEMEKYNDF